mmetsp:Transcript_26050/g.47080  ORF Transcript_26050/g.47080 Transcript_26050/m.47080 type:complete len:315 (-) Transcript_26050:1402-2346(-)
MSKRNRIGGLFTVWALTVALLSENGRAFTTLPRLALGRTQITHQRDFKAFSNSKQHQQRLQAQNLGESEGRFQLFRRNPVRQQNVSVSKRSRILNKIRRAILIMCTAALLWFGGATLSMSPSYAASTAAASSEPITSRVIPKGASLDQIVDRYVKDHMFDDDVYDPLESAYIESYDDATTGRYPRALNEVASSLLGSDVTKTSEQKTSENLFISLLSNGTTALQRLGLSTTLSAVIVYAATLIGIPGAVLIGILSYANAQKRMRISQNKKRYGADYSLDATIKVEEDVELPADDEDSDDDEDDEDDDEDDDDDE